MTTRVQQGPRDRPTWSVRLASSHGCTRRDNVPTGAKAGQAHAFRSLRRAEARGGAAVLLRRGLRAQVSNRVHSPIRPVWKLTVVAPSRPRRSVHRVPDRRDVRLDDADDARGTQLRIRSDAPSQDRRSRERRMYSPRSEPCTKMGRQTCTRASPSRCEIFRKKGASRGCDAGKAGAPRTSNPEYHLGTVINYCQLSRMFCNSLKNGGGAGIWTGGATPCQPITGKHVVAILSIQPKGRDEVHFKYNGAARMGPKLGCVRRAEHRCRPVHTSARRWLAPVQAARL